jgi:hypothetical protein
MKGKKVEQQRSLYEVIMKLMDALLLANKKYGFRGQRENLGSYVPGHGRRVRYKDLMEKTP